MRFIVLVVIAEVMRFIVLSSSLLLVILMALPQGDLEMYTPNNIAARKKLFDHPDVVVLIKLFWKVVRIGMS